MGADISGRWISEAIELLERLWKTQAAALDEAVALCADAIGDGGLVHLFGTGHSRIPVEEMFPRYGSYPGFHPIVELAVGARRRGLPVIAVTSLAQSNAAPPQHSSGTRLYDHADVVIDLCTPPGDALVEVDGLESPVGPVSSIAAIAVVNEIKV